MNPPSIKPRILIVEDENLIARDIELQLVDLGYDPVAHATSAEQAVTLAGELRPDLVLMDIQLGGTMDGITAAQAIRAQFALPVVFLTAFAADDTLARAKLTEPFGYILKPFSERELRTTLEMALHKHRIEEKLRVSELRFRTIFQFEPEGVEVLGADGEVLELNAATLAMLEASSVEEVKARGLIHFVQPEYREACLNLHRRALSSQEASLEYEILGLAGTRRWVETHAAPLPDASGQVKMMLGITRDITERKRAESALLHHADFVAGLSQAVHDLLGHRELNDLLPATVQRAATIFHAAHVRILLKEGSRLVARAAWSDPVRAAALSLLLDNLNLDLAHAACTGGQPVQSRVVAPGSGSAEAGHAPVLHLPIVLGDQCLGLLILLRLESAVAFSAEEIAETRQFAEALALILHNAQLLATLQEDLHERERAELKIKESETRLANVIDSVTDAIITVNAQQKILIFNPAAEAIFGLPRAEALGQSLERFLPPRLRTGPPSTVADSPGSGSVPRIMGHPGIVTGLRASGEEFPVEASISRIKHGDDMLLTVSLRDVSEQRKAEVKRHELEARLMQSQKLETLGTLAGGIAHDFNNLLTGVIGFVELALHVLPPDHEVVDYLRHARAGGLRSRDLVKRLLLFARRAPDTVRQPLALQQVVQDCVSLLTATLPASIVVRTEIAGAVPLVLADATQMQQVLMNLGVNASHAIGAQQGQITLEVQIAEVSLGDGLPCAPGHYVRLSVADNGCGMDEATQSRIFEPFFTTKSPGEGTGLGLAIVHGIVHEHGGGIRVRSTVGQGTRFEIFLPVTTETKSTTAPPMSAAAALRGAGQRVLLADDDRHVLEYAQAVLERADFVVEACDDGHAATEAFQSDPQAYALAIIDLSMPGRTGIELVTELRRLRSDLPIILMSGDHERYGHKLRTTAVDVPRLNKPFSPEELAAAIRQVLLPSVPSPRQKPGR